LEEENKASIYKALSEVREMMQDKQKDQNLDANEAHDDNDILELAGHEIHDTSTPEINTAAETTDYTASTPESSVDINTANNFENNSPIIPTDQNNMPVNDSEHLSINTNESLPDGNLTEEQPSIDMPDESVEFEQYIEDAPEDGSEEESTEDIEGQELETEQIDNNLYESEEQAEQEDYLSEPDGEQTESSNPIDPGPFGEDLVKELAKPYIDHWLDQNLANIVKEVVEVEIKKLLSRGK
jgi:cell pole-organizing protein PopZ